MPSIKQQLRQEILRQRGLVKGKGGKLKFNTIMPFKGSTNSSLTLAMRLLEEVHQQSIEDLLAVHLPLRRVARNLGVDVSTVSKWRTRLGMQ